MTRAIVSNEEGIISPQKSGCRLPHKGFTLIELVLGLAITATVVALLFAALRLGHRAEEQGTKRAERAQIIRVLTDRLTWLVRGAYPYVDERDGKRSIAFIGGPDRMEFVTSSADPYDKESPSKGGLVRVTLYADGRGLVVAKRIFFTNEDDGVSEENEDVFMTEVRSLTFEYLKPDLDTNNQPTGKSTWEDAWGEDVKDAVVPLYLPLAVKMTLKYRHDNVDFALPELVVRIPAGGPANSR